MSKVCSNCGVNERKVAKSGTLYNVCNACKAAKAKQYRDANKDKIAAKKKRDYLKDKERINKRNMDNYYANKESRRRSGSEYQRKQRKVNQFYYFKDKLRNLIRISFKQENYTKRSKTHEIVGLDFETLKNYLEYTWFQNYGTEYAGEKVHIDHVIPLSTAKTEEDVIKLNHYTNLQYLTPDDNKKKHNRYQI